MTALRSTCSSPGPKDFQARSPADRAKSRQTEIAHYKKMIAYLKRQQAELKPGYGDAVAAAEARLAQLEDADRKVTADGASGWQSFELRGTYLCRNGQVPSGALDLYASTSVVMNAASGATYRVKIRDLSNRIESDLEFNGEGESFHAALESAFVHLCKAYPEGKISVLGEDMVLDASLTAKPNGRMIGFELPTTSAWKRAKSKVFDPVVQTLANAAAMAIMVVFPPSAAAIVPMLAVADIVHNVDDMVTRRDKGKLAFKTAAIDIAAIGLDILPAARGAKFLNPSRAVIQELKGTSWRLVAFDGVNLAGQTVVMAERTRDELATIQDKQIAGLAERYRELLELESQSDNPSDPGIARKRAELDDDAKAIRDTVVTTWTHAVTNQATFFVGTHLLEPAPHAHADDAHPHTPRVREPQHDDSDAHDARRPDQRKSHEDRESDRLPRPHERDTVTPTEDRPPSAAWSTDAKPGASASPETIRVGTVKMEDHPDFKPMLDEAESKGFRIEYSFRTNVEVRHVMDPAGNLLEIRKTLRLIPGMRYLDLEHEMGHIRQLERFGSAPPPTEKKIKRGDMEVDAKGDLAQGKLTSKMDTIVEYHNRLQEYVRLAERGADSVVLGEHGQGVEGWRKWAESTGKLGYGGRMDAWAKQYFGDIPELEAKCRKLGLVLDTKTKRW